MNEKLRTPLALKNISNTPHLANKSKTNKNQIQSKKVEFEKEQLSDSEDEIIDHSQCGFEENEIPVMNIVFADEEIREKDEFDSTASQCEIEDMWKDMPDLKLNIIGELDMQNDIKIKSWLDEGLIFSEFN
jgi:hypothetical protein